MITRSRLAAFLALAAPALVGQAWAGTNVYGGYDISGGHEAAYGETRGWRVVSASVDGKFAYCAGELADGDTVWRLGYDNMQWQLGVPYMASPGEWQGEYEIDGRRMPASGVASGGWSYMWLGLQELDEVRNGNEIVLDIGRASIAHPLKGTAAVITKIEECVSRQGRVGNASVAASAQAELYPTFEACQPAGSARTERDGAPAAVTFRVDESVGATLTLNWIDHNGQVHPYGQLAPGQSMQMNTYTGHLWMATDGGSCAYQEVEAGARVITFVVDAAPAVQPHAAACPGGEQALPLTGLCPSEAVEAFLSSNARLNQPAQLHPGCTTWLNETGMAGDVLLYGALKCGNWIGKLDYAAGARSAELTAQSNGEQGGDVSITVLAADESDPAVTINRFARQAIKDPNMRGRCTAQDHPAGNGFIFDLEPKFAAKRDGPSGGECGPYGDSNGPNHWQAFGGNVWYMDITDFEHSVNVNAMTLLERDTRGDGLKGWRVKY